jgi:hypothetical protein
MHKKPGHAKRLQDTRMPNRESKFSQPSQKHHGISGTCFVTRKKSLRQFITPDCNSLFDRVNNFLLFEGRSLSVPLGNLLQPHDYILNVH